MSGWANLWALAPILTFGFGLLALRKGGETWSGAVARGAVLWALLAWGGSNLLGLFGELRPGPLRVFWFCALLTTVLVARRSAGRREGAGGGPSIQTWEWPLAIGVGGLIGFTAVIAAVAPPATVDVLSYHLPRQLMWLQNGSLEHFPTLNDRMLMMPPLAEVIGLQFLALTGDDHWVNLPQWAAYTGLPLLMIAAVRRLGGGNAGAWLGAWWTVTLPMAYHEATGAKNDLMGAFWLMVVLLEVLRVRVERNGTREGFWLGGAVAVALLTKSTAFLFLPPLAVAWVWLRRRERGGFGAWSKLGVATLVVLLMTGPFFIRNLAWYGAPLGVHRAEDGGQQANSRVGPGVVASNLLRNATLHLAGPFPGWNEALEAWVREAHRGWGLDVDDPETTLWVTKYQVGYAPDAETEAGAPVQALLLALALVAVWRRRFAGPVQGLALVVLAIGLAYLLVLKWQPWGARLQLPLFVVGMTLTAVVAARSFPRWLPMGLIAGFVLGGVAWWPSRETRLRPWKTHPTIFEVSRDLGRQRNLPALVGRDRRVVDLIREAGLRETVLLSIHDCVYPLMRLVRREVPEFRFSGGRGDAPESFLVCEYFKPLELTRTWKDGTTYRLVGDESGDGLYLREDLVRRLGWEGRLPAVAGWTGQRGLNLAISGEWLESPQLVWRQLEGPVVELDFHSDEESTFGVGLTICKGQARGMELSALVGGEVVGTSAELKGPSVRVDWEFFVPVRPGWNRIELRAGEHDWNEMVFTRIQIAPLRVPLPGRRDTPANAQP